MIKDNRYFKITAKLFYCLGWTIGFAMTAALAPALGWILMAYFIAPSESVNPETGLSQLFMDLALYASVLGGFTGFLLGLSGKLPGTKLKKRSPSFLPPLPSSDMSLPKE